MLRGLFFLIISFNVFASEDLRSSFLEIEKAQEQKNRIILEGESKNLKKSRLFEHYSDLFRSESVLIHAQEAYSASNFKLAIEKAKEARWKFSEILVIEPYFPFVERVQKNVFQSEVILAESYLKEKNHFLSVHYFENAFVRVPHSQLMIHVTWNNLQHYTHACVLSGKKICESWISIFLDKYPKKSIEYNELSKNFPEIVKLNSEKNEKKIIQNYRAEDKDDFEFKEIFSLYLGKKYSKATEGFEKFLIDYPLSKHKSRVLYWLSQTHKKRKNKKKYTETTIELMREYPFTYYGLMAAFDIGKSIDEAVSAELPPLQTKINGLKKGEQEAIKRIEYFIKNKLFSFAAHELNQLSVSSRMPKDFLMYLADLSYKSKAYLASFRFLNEYFQREGQRPFSSRHLSIIFPEVYLDKITPSAQKYKIDPLLILSLMKQESGFQADAISHAGAVGLMQLMPFSAIVVKPKIYQFQVNDVQKNIEMGIEHLANELKISKGNIPVALAAYNAGAGRARGWWSDAVKNKSNLAEFIEQITFSETRGYVSSILRNYYWYTKRINGKKLTSFDFLLTPEKN